MSVQVVELDAKHGSNATAAGAAAAGAAAAGAAARTLRERYRAAGLRPRKRLGQHFLADLNLARKIVDELPPPAAAGPVLEIGAGLGALTFLIAARGHAGVAVEVDAQLAAWLAEALAPWPRLRVAGEDVRTLDFAAAAGATRLCVVGNLPYCITSDIVLQLVREAPVLERAVIMVQDDVAARLAAPPGTRAYGSLTVAVALRFEVQPVVRAPRQAFWPAPEVDSMVLRLVPRQAPDLGDPVRLEQVVRAAFAQRRKTLAKGLAAGLALERPAVEAELRALGLDPACRAETLAPGDFVRLARALSLPGEAPQP